MKIRNGFVTNSSSSSFIISKNNKMLAPCTVENVYRYILELYDDFEKHVKQVVDKAIQYGFIDEDTPASREKLYDIVVHSTGKKVEAFYNWIENTVDIDPYSVSDVIRMTDIKGPGAWRNNYSYKEYLDWAKKKGIKPATVKEAPILLIDYETDELKDGSAEKDAVFETAAWYEYDKLRSIRGETREENDAQIRKLMLTLGNVEVFSENCLIPSDIQYALSVISNKSCAHMG